MHEFVEILIMLILNPSGKPLEFDILYKSAERTVLLICIISSVGTDCVQIVCHTMLATLYVHCKIENISVSKVGQGGL